MVFNFKKEAKMISYKTGQRKIIMDYLVNHENEFVNAEEILEYMKKHKQEVGLTTIYRFLNKLEKENSLRVETRNHTKYYQYVPQEEGNHLFLKCKECGKSLNLDCHEVDEINQHIKDEHKFKLDYNTIIYGTCDNCSK
jgi:Fur family ferric uptake transcriptional regulator